MKRKVLIVGLGISGMSAAISLKKQGWFPVLIERSSERRKGGYFIGLREEGKQAAESLGAFKYMPNRTPQKAQFYDITKDGNRRPIRDITNETNAPVALRRGDIEEALWKVIDESIEVRFDTGPVSITNKEFTASVSLRQGDGPVYEEDYDLVIGADGIRSSVREMVFGSDDNFLHPVGTVLCAFPLSEQLKGFSQGDGIIIAEKGRSLTVFPLANMPPTALFSYRISEEKVTSKKLPAETLHKIFSGLDNSGLISSVLDELSGTQDYVFDTVNMVKMSSWSKGRVVLLGDAAWCLTLYSGMGASAGMIGGVALGNALAGNESNIDDALNEYEKSMRPFIEKHQRFVRLRSQLFVPSSNFFVKIRRFLWKILTKSIK